MSTRRLLVSTIVLASFGTACTAIVLGKIGDTGDYPTSASSGSSSSGAELDKCSLLRGDSFGTDRDANACSTCIQTQCESDVAYACNGGTKSKPWFSKLKDCAKEPWTSGARPPSEPGSGSYKCKSYETPTEAISDNGSDTEREPQAHNCVNTNCMKGEEPACKMCEVSTKKPGSVGEPSLLRDDPCGQCLVANCQATIVKCCDTNGMRFVEACAFTGSQANKLMCQELGTTQPDAGEDLRLGDAGGKCLDEISACFKAKCQNLAACQ